MRLGSVIFFTGIKRGPLHAITYKGLEIEVDSEGGREVVVGSLKQQEES